MHTWVYWGIWSVGYNRAYSGSGHTVVCGILEHMKDWGIVWHMVGWGIV